MVKSSTARILTTRDRLTATFWGRARMRILIEASTESEWVAQHLESLGHEVIVADPNYGAMYARRSRRVKTIGAMPRRWLTRVSMEITARLIAGPRGSGSCNRCSTFAGN